MLRSVLVSVWMSAGVLLLPSLVALATVRPRAHLADVDHRARGSRAAVAATTVGLLSLGVSAPLDAGPGAATVAAAVLGGAVLTAVWRCSDWAVRGAVAWAVLVVGGAAFLAWLLDRLLGASLTGGQAVLSGSAWVLLVLAALRLLAPAEAAVAARAQARRSEQAPTLPPLRRQLRRQLWPIAAMVTAGAVAVVGTSIGGETEGARRAGPPVDPGGQPPSSAATSSTTRNPPDQAPPPPPDHGPADGGDAAAAPTSRDHGPGQVSGARPARGPDSGPRGKGRAGRRERSAEQAIVERVLGQWAAEDRAGGRPGGDRPERVTGAPRQDGPVAGPTARASAKASPSRKARASARASVPGEARASAKGDDRKRVRPSARATARESGRPTPRAGGRPSTRPRKRPSTSPGPGRSPRPPERPLRPRESATADTWEELLRREPRPLDWPTKVWGVMPHDALPQQERWAHPALRRERW